VGDDELVVSAIAQARRLPMSTPGPRLFRFIERLISPSPRVRAHLIDVVVLLLPFAVFYWLLPGGPNTIGQDYPVFSTPHQLELQFSVARGSFPLYLHGWAGGRSAAAATLGQSFHPLTYLATHSPGYWRGHALTCNTFWRLFSLGLTQLALLRVVRRAGLRADLAFVASFVAVYNLRMLDMFRYGASLENYTGMLLLCAALMDAYVNPRPRRSALQVVGATYLLICGGHPQMAYLGFLGAAIFLAAVPFVVSALRAEEPPCARDALAFYGRASLWIACGVLLASAYLLPYYIEFVRDAPHRTTQEYSWSLECSDTLRGALNSLFTPLHADVHGAFGSSALAALALSAPFALAPTRGVPGRGVAAALVATTIVVFLCSVGADSPLHHVFWGRVPLANTFRVPGRIGVMLPALLVLLSAWTFVRLDRAAALGHQAFSPALLVAQVAVMFGLWHLLPDRVTISEAGYTPGKIHEYPKWIDRAIFGLGAATLALAAVRFSRWRYGRLAGVVLAAVVIVQGALQLRHGTWVAPRAASVSYANQKAARAASLKFTGDPGYHNEPSVQLITDGRPAGFVRFDRGAPTSANEDRIATTYATYNRLTFKANVAGAGDLALEIPYSPRWHARVDGREVPVSKSKWNEVQLPVSTGHHEVDVRFESPASVLGMSLSCLTLAALGIFGAGALNRRAARVVAATLAIALAATTFVAWRSSLYTGKDLGTRFSWPTEAAGQA
jgi:hypothetical protein